MKKLLRLPLINFLILFSFNLFAQTQNAFNFQAVIRNDTGELLSNQEIKVLFEILENNPNGEVIFLQESDVTSNKYGLITAEIGNDEIVEGDFSNISWSENSYFIRISVDFEASGNYEEIGVSQLLSVPYAMYAKSSGNSYWEKSEEGIYNSTDNVSIGSNSPSNLLSISLPETGDQKDKGFSLSRNDGFLNLINGTLYDGHFQARISGKSTHEDSPGIIITATPAIDEINKNGIILRSGEHAPLQNANALTVQNFDQSLVTVKPDGKTGFGLENPNYQVDVNGGVNASNFYISGEAIKSGVWNENQNDIFFNSGNIGVGNSSPNNLLNISLPETGDQKDKGFSLSRNDGFLNLINGTLYDGHFQARISGKSTHEDSPGIIITATPAIDEINKNGIILRSGEHAPLQNANALTVQNFDQSLFTVKADGKTGIGTTNPKSKLQVTNGDIYIENASSGVIMTSPDGNCWRMTVDNTGNPQFSSVTCPE